MLDFRERKGEFLSAAALSLGTNCQQSVCVTYCEETSGNLIDFFPMISSLRTKKSILELEREGGWRSNLGKPKGFEVLAAEVTLLLLLPIPPDQMLTSSLCTSSFIIFVFNFLGLEN